MSQEPILSEEPAPAAFLRVLPSISKRRLLLLVVMAALTLVLLLTWGGGNRALTVLADTDLRWIGLALVIHYSGFVLRGLRWQQLLRSLGHDLPWRTCMTLLLSGWFVSALVPARAGDLLRIGILRSSAQSHPPVPIADGLSSIVLERVLDLLALVMLGAWVGFLTLRAQLPAWVLWLYVITLLLLAIGGIFLLVAPTILHWLQARFTARRWQQLMAFADDVTRAMRTLLLRPGVAIIVFGQSLVIWLCDALLMWLVLLAMGVSTPFVSIAFVALTVDIAAAVPVTPGGIGQIEAVNAALLALLPLPTFNIAVAVLLNRAISYWSFLLFSGIVTLFAGVGPLLQKPWQPTMDITTITEE